MDRSNIAFPFAINEHARLKEIREVIGSERRTDDLVQRIVERVSDIFETPAALVSVVESDHQWFLAKTGVDLDSTPRDYSICSRAIMSEQPLVLPDTLEHPELKYHPAVALEPKIRFYIGAPIILSSGFRVGSVCAIDVTPHEAPSEEAIRKLQSFANEVVTHLEQKHADRTGGNQSKRYQIASEAQQEFLALVGHEFRTPLTVLLGNARLLKAHLSGELEMDADLAGKFTDRSISAITASGEHLHKLIEHIIGFSKLQNGELFLAEEVFSCDGLLDAVVHPIEPIVTASHRNVQKRCAGDTQTIRGDGEQLSLALSSLVTNAATHGEGHIELVASRGDDRTLHLTCYDEGPGLAQGQAERSDRPFAVGGAVMTRARGGLGLGLPLAKKIAELHGGVLRSGKNEMRSWVEMVLPSWRGADALG